MRGSRRRMSVALLGLALAGCGNGASTKAPAGAKEPPVPITNRIDIPAPVRRNLGITFVKVAMRNVQRTRRLPGQFEFVAEATRAYHAALGGQVELAVKQYQQVEPGTVLFRIDAPAWRDLQTSFTGTVIAIRKAKTRRDALVVRAKAVQEHMTHVDGERAIWERRVGDLERLASLKAGNRTVLTEAQAKLASVETAIAEVAEEEALLATELAAVDAELAGHRGSTPLLYAEALGPQAPGDGSAAPRDLALSRAAALLGTTVEALREPVGDTPRWRVIDRLEVIAQQAGTVQVMHATNGSWIEAGAVVLETVDPKLVRFRASGLQADLGFLKDGLAATVLPPGGVVAEEGDTLPGTLKLGIEADPLSRKIDLLITPVGSERPHWARSGVSTEVEVVLTGTSEPQMAIPLASVIKDGLEKVIFRRDPKDPDKVIRVQADLGLTDGRWVVLESGVMEGDEIVHHGVYELMLSSGGSKLEGGHFHADGTWHAGADH